MRSGRCVKGGAPGAGLRLSLGRFPGVRATDSAPEKNSEIRVDGDYPAGYDCPLQVVGGDRHLRTPDVKQFESLSSKSVVLSSTRLYRPRYKVLLKTMCPACW